MGLFRNKRKDDDRKLVTTPASQRAPLFFPTFGTLADQPLRWITPDNVLGVPAFWRGINLIAGSIAQMAPFDCLNGSKVVDTPLILSKPVPNQDLFDTIHSAVAELIVTGNYYALLVDLDEFGTAQQILPVPSTSVNPRFNDAGRLVYAVSGIDDEMDPSRLLHVRNFTRPGDPVGIGVVGAFTRELSTQVDRQVAATQMTTGRPTGIVKVHVNDLDPLQAQETKAAWYEAFGPGSTGVAVMSDKMDYSDIGVNAEQSQWAETEAVSIAHAAFMLNLDPADLGAASGGMTYANITDRQVDRITNSYGPYIRRLDQAFSSLLPGRLTARLNVENLLRTSPQARALFLQTMIQSGVYSVSYAQELENVPMEYRTATQVAA